MQIIDFIICDDIRFETNGKRSFIGVMENTLPIVEVEKNDTWPKHISFGLSIKAIMSPEEVKKDPESLELLFKIDDQVKSVGKSNMPATPVIGTERNKISLAVVFKNMPIEKPGKLSAILIVRDKNDEVIVKEESTSSIMLQSKVVKSLKVPGNQ